MGHEYVEMKNSHAAIEAYRKAVGRLFRYSHVIVRPCFQTLIIFLATYSFFCFTSVNDVANCQLLDVDRKDYRAWYGLGQAYELLSMHQYALYYYQHATALRCVKLKLSLLRSRG